MATPNSVTALTPFAVTVSRPERLFPKLTVAQLARIAAHGRRRVSTRDELLIDVGDRIVPCFVVLAGEIQALQVSDGAETLIVSHGPGSFTGEANLISGRPSMATSSESRRPSAKGRSPSRWCIRCFDRKGCHVRSELCPHHCHCQRQAPKTTGVPGVRQDRRNLGSSPYLSGVRRHALLRQLA